MKDVCSGVVRDHDVVVTRQRIRVRGTVQGVGFRPFVHTTATRLGLAGFVLNDPGGVLIEVEGHTTEVAAFEQALQRDAPPPASVESVFSERIPVAGGSRFEIRASVTRGEIRAAVTPDVATCDECLCEISDSDRRRHRYPFTNCTHCGPRFTITTEIPYDRPNTTMAAFKMCPACKAEYENPTDRRFHAQPIACPDCGPRPRLLTADLQEIAGDSIEQTASLLRAGKVVAIKGLGGYHLACDATNDGAVSELRRRKAREEKPLAVMAPDVSWVRKSTAADAADIAVLGSRRRPIVLLRRGADATVAPAVAPGNRFLGVMLPYTPLHHLLMRAVACPLVMTSGNMSDEPIAFDDDEAFTRLGPVADAFLSHDRTIRIRCDDSVVRVIDGAEYPIRRSRGFVPEQLSLASSLTRSVLAAGPHLKHTFCLATGHHAIVSHHIGDLESYEAMTAFLDGIEHFTRVFRFKAEVVAYDLHPEYLSTKWALGLPDVEKVGIQHHHAHIASCLADNERSERVIGLALDGTGYGDDGAIWGCEVLACDVASYERLGHLRYLPLPGGVAAIRQPWRMAAVYLDAAFGEDARDLALPFVRRTRTYWGPILEVARKGINAPKTSSAGRLFDAVAALCGLRERVSYEGQAAAELEQLADPSVADTYPCPVSDGELDGVTLVGAIADDLARGRPAPEVAGAFHNTLARALAEACAEARDRTGLETVALSGGTFQNLLLVGRTRRVLEERGFGVLIHRRVPPNDGGIALGQAVVAGST